MKAKRKQQMFRIPETVKLLADLPEADFICSVAQAILLRSQNMPAAYREQLTATIRAEIARLIEQGYPLDHRSLIIYTIMISSILYFQRNTTGSALISSKY
jgi:hypothetical protein